MLSGKYNMQKMRNVIPFLEKTYVCVCVYLCTHTHVQASVFMYPSLTGTHLERSTVL